MAAKIPLWERIAPADLTRICGLIASGLYTRDAAFNSLIRIHRVNVWRAMAEGDAAARAEADGKRLTNRERAAAEFFLTVQQAEAQQHGKLRQYALGIEIAGGKTIRDPRKESMGAQQMLRLNDRYSRATYDADELEEVRRYEAAKRGDPPEVDETSEEAAPATPAQTEAYLRREAARLGMMLVPAPDGGGGE